MTHIIVHNRVLLCSTGANHKDRQDLRVVRQVYEL
jgi:hypothetical protein